MIWKLPPPDGFKPHPMLNWLLIAAIGLAFAMALIGKYDSHPDEKEHFEATRYYFDHFLPPVIGDPAVRASYSFWGDSYLNYHWVEYLFAGKFALLLSSPGVSQLIAARLFQFFLFACLSTLFFYRAGNVRQEFIIPSFLLITPQIWYIFSYINNDAFAFVISILLSYQVACTNSSFNKFLQAGQMSEKYFSGVLVGLLAGALLTCKPNYWVFLIFISLWVLFDKPLNLHRLRRFAFILLIAVLFVGFRIKLDYHVNGETNFVGLSYINYVFSDYENKQGKLHAYQEEVADICCKPSTLRNNLMNSYPSLKLKAKGTPFAGLFYKYDWHRYSFYSFVGLYGYMAVSAGPNYYRCMLLLYAIFTLYLVLSVIRSRNGQAIGQLLITAFGCFLSAFVSVMMSWSYAFQPQGRYLFPIIGMIGLLVYSNRQNLHNWILHGFILAAFLLSLYSFVFVGLQKLKS